jgi:hypothetical protein
MGKWNCKAHFIVFTCNSRGNGVASKGLGIAHAVSYFCQSILSDSSAAIGGGDPLWNIPFSQEENRPWTGISTEAVSPDDFSNIRYQLTAFSGPGQMSLLQWGVFGDPLLKIQTSNGLERGCNRCSRAYPCSLRMVFYRAGRLHL